MCSCLVFPAPLIEEAVFSPLLILASFVKDKVTICVWVYLCAFYPVPLIFISVFVPVPQCLDYLSFVLQSEVRELDSPSPVFLSQDCFGIRGLLCFHTNCEFFCSSSVKNASGSLIGIILNLYITLGSIVVFTMLILPIQEHGISLHLFVFINFSHQRLRVFCIHVFCLLRQVFSQVFYSFCCNGKWDCFINFSFRFFIFSVYECKRFLCIHFVS